MTTDGRLLLIETATRQAVVAVADRGGALVAVDRWHSGHRHGEELLPRLDHLLTSSGTARTNLAGVAVGTGPGSFTGLRIGMATAKTIAYSLGIPIVGLPTLELLAAAAQEQVGDRPVAIVLPAGVGDRYVARYQAAAGKLSELLPPTLVPGADVDRHLIDRDVRLAVDLPDGEASAEAAEVGRLAQERLAVAFAAQAAAALAEGRLAELAALVPQYVALPRGVPASIEQMAWSPDLR